MYALFKGNADMTTCELCPRKCGRRPGYCGAGEKPRVFRWGLHFGEEPPLTGERGSGCVFFSRCTMKCVYCQNSPWSWQGEGNDKSVAELAAIFKTIAVDDKAENWNLVSPTPYLPFIREALDSLASEGIDLPRVWNSSGYERVKTLEEYADLCDTALFDLRYSRDDTALRYSSAPDYVQRARAAVKWAWRRKSPRSDIPLVLRILVLPGHAEEAIENLKWVAKELSNEIPLSLMSQYTPAYQAVSIPPLDRTIGIDEYEMVTDAAADLGFDSGWIQSLDSANPETALLGENMPPDHGAIYGIM